MAFVCGGIQNFNDFGRLEKFNVIHRNLGFNIRAGEKNTAFSAVFFSPAVGVWGQSAPKYARMFYHAVFGVVFCAFGR
jgi:hypothetical protein